MKKIVIGIFVLVMSLLFFNQKEETASAVQLENIEALAGDIMPLGIHCGGSGSVDCPTTGVKVKTVINSGRDQ